MHQIIQREVIKKNEDKFTKVLLKMSKNMELCISDELHILEMNQKTLLKYIIALIAEHGDNALTFALSALWTLYGMFPSGLREITENDILKFTDELDEHFEKYRTFSTRASIENSRVYKLQPFLVEFINRKLLYGISSKFITENNANGLAFVGYVIICAFDCACRNS